MQCAVVERSGLISTTHVSLMCTDISTWEFSLLNRKAFTTAKIKQASSEEQAGCEPTQ